MADANSTLDSTDSPRGMRVREARADEALAVRRVLDAALLESTAVDDAVARRNALVAVADDRVIGALVLVSHERVTLPDGVAGDGGMHVDAVAVTRRRRGQGVGRALVTAALQRERRLTVAFEPRVQAFYEALDFEPVTVEDAGVEKEAGDEAGVDEDRIWAERTLDG